MTLCSQKKFNQKTQNSNKNDPFFSHFLELLSKGAPLPCICVPLLSFSGWKLSFCKPKITPYLQIITPISQRKKYLVSQPFDNQSFTKFATFQNLKPTSLSPPNSSLSRLQKNSLCQRNGIFPDKVENQGDFHLGKVTLFS